MCTLKNWDLILLHAVNNHHFKTCLQVCNRIKGIQLLNLIILDCNRHQDKVQAITINITINLVLRLKDNSHNLTLLKIIMVVIPLNLIRRTLISKINSLSQSSQDSKWLQPSNNWRSGKDLVHFLAWLALMTYLWIKKHSVLPEWEIHSKANLMYLVIQDPYQSKAALKIF